MMRKLAGLTLAAFAFTAPAPAQDSVLEPDGFRTENYRAPVPATLAGARVLTTAEAEAVWRAGTAGFFGGVAPPPKTPKTPARPILGGQPRAHQTPRRLAPGEGGGKPAPPPGG